MERNRQYEQELTLYRIGGLALGAVLLLFGIAEVLRIHPFTVLGKTFGPCPFYRITGLFCPACGGTRAVWAFIHGRIVKSFLWNGFVCYALTGYLLFMGSWTLFYITKGRIRGMRFHMAYMYIGVVIALVHWIIKNAGVLF